MELLVLVLCAALIGSTWLILKLVIALEGRR
jgi:hypothetical protein